MFGVVSPRHRYAVGDLSLVEPGADFIAPPREDRSAAAVAEDLASQAGTAPIRSSIVRKLLELYKHPNLGLRQLRLRRSTLGVRHWSEGKFRRLRVG